MTEEFSKLSLKSKSIITSQTMNWTIPQSRLNQHCPFLEREFPYFTTDFSFLHFSSTGLELKWRLVLQKRGDFVTINLINTNDGSVFERKEMKNVELRWNLIHQLSEESSLGEDVSILDESPTVSIDFQTLRFGTPKGFPLCKLEDFESFAANGWFTFDIKIYLEYFQEKKKFSLIQQAKKLSSSISEISSIYSKSRRSRSSVSSNQRNSVESNSWIGRTLPSLMTNSLERESSFSKPTYQCSRPPSPPPPMLPDQPYLSARDSPYHAQARDYHYQEPIYSCPGQLSSELSSPTPTMFKQIQCDPDPDMIRRSKSGRLPSVVGHLNRADDTLDSLITGHESLETAYSNLPDVFYTPLKQSTASSQEVKSMFKSLSSQQFLSLSSPRPQSASTPQPQPIYANSPDTTLHRASQSFRKNFLYSSRKGLPGMSPAVSSVKTGSRNYRSVNRSGLPHSVQEAPAEENLAMGSSSKQVDKIDKRLYCSGVDNVCII